MRNKVNPVAIGMFVLGASILAVAAVILFGAAKFFTQTEKCISLFSESVNGLDVGAPVKYKGVRIGKVEAIRIGPHNKTMKESSVAVIYSIDIDMLRRKIGDENFDYDLWMRAQISEGMRAKLNYQSIVTGMLYVELDYLAEPGSAFELKYGGTRFMEIPGAKSGLAEIAKALQESIEDIAKIDFEELASKADSLLAKMGKKLDDLDVKSISDSAVATLKSVDAIATDPNLKNALLDLDILMKDSSEFLRMTQGQIIDVSTSAKKTLSNADGVLENVNSILMPQSPFRFEVALLIRSLNESATSLTNLTDYLQRNPNSLITGKANNKSE